MNIEIRKVANGYLVKPMYDYYARGETFHEDQVWVFNSYSALIDKLQEILEKPEPKP